jgi:hypothetical protein
VSFRQQNENFDKTTGISRPSGLPRHAQYSAAFWPTGNGTCDDSQVITLVNDTIISQRREESNLRGREHGLYMYLPGPVPPALTE